MGAWIREAKDISEQPATQYHRTEPILEVRMSVGQLVLSQVERSEGWLWCEPHGTTVVV